MNKKFLTVAALVLSLIVGVATAMEIPALPKRATSGTIPMSPSWSAKAKPVIPGLIGMALVGDGLDGFFKGALGNYFARFLKKLPKTEWVRKKIEGRSAEYQKAAKASPKAHYVKQTLKLAVGALACWYTYHVYTSAVLSQPQPASNPDALSSVAVNVSTPALEAIGGSKPRSPKLWPSLGPNVPQAQGQKIVKTIIQSLENIERPSFASKIPFANTIQDRHLDDWLKLYMHEWLKDSNVVQQVAWIKDDSAWTEVVGGMFYHTITTKPDCGKLEVMFAQKVKEDLSLENITLEEYIITYTQTFIKNYFDREK